MMIYQGYLSTLNTTCTCLLHSDSIECFKQIFHYKFIFQDHLFYGDIGDV